MIYALNLCESHLKKYSLQQLPPYRFIPGINPHPYKEKQGYNYGKSEPTFVGTTKQFYNEEFYKFALDLFNNGHYWEAHIYFESLWNSFGRKGQQADYFKGLIQLCAAAVNLSQLKYEIFITQFKRAKELLTHLPLKFHVFEWPEENFELAILQNRSVIYSFLKIYGP